MDAEENNLIGRAQEGDEASIAALYRRHENAVRRRIYRRLPQRLRRRISVSDVVQETLITAIQRLREGAWTHDGSFRAWVGKIADNKALQVTRFHLGTAKRAMGTELSQPDRPDTAAFAGAGESPSRLAMRVESHQQLDSGLSELSEDHRLVIDLVHRHGCTLVEAGERMGRSADAARKLYARAIAALAKILNREED